MVVMLAVVLMVMLSLPLVLLLVTFGFQKHVIRGSYVWCVLLPLNPKGLLREAPRNLWDGSCCNRSSFEFEPLDANGIMLRDF